MSPRRMPWLATLLLGVFATAQATETVVYYHTDALHSTTVVTNAQGQVIERTHYAPYGAVLNRALRDGPGYAGHEEDAATGLVYMQQRYYDPESGTFLSTDSVQADPNTGASFNRYWYANDNPYRFTDPDGRETGLALQAINQGVEYPQVPAGPAGKVIAGATLALVAAPVAIGVGIAALANPATATAIVNTVAEGLAGDALGGASLTAGAGAATAGAHALAEDAIVARGGSEVGANSAEGIANAVGTHPSGVTGFSAESANGATLSDLGKNIPNNKIGTTTAGQIRSAGGDVISTGGRSPNHATVTGLSPDKAHELLTPTVPNPVPKPDRTF